MHLKQITQNNLTYQKATTSHIKGSLIKRLTINKSFLKPHLDYGDVIYDRAFNEFFQKELEYVQYNAVLEIMGAIRGSSRRSLPGIRS